MLCAHCHSPIHEDQEYCPKCGTKIELKKPRSIKKFIFLSLAVFFVLFIFIQSLSTKYDNEMLDTIEGQLKALRNKKVTEAYYAYTSKDFQNNVPLKTFRELINTYAALSQNKGIAIDENVFVDNFAVLKGNLKSDSNQKTPVEYELIKEDSKWKILSILLAVPQPVQGQHQPTIEWLVPVDAQLRLLREKKFKEAYEDIHSTQFKKATSFEDFENFLKKNPIFTIHSNVIVKAQSLQKDEAQVTIVLNPEKDAVQVQYLLVKEDGKWKIWNMNLIPGQTSKAEQLLKNTDDGIRKKVEEHLDTIRKQEIIKAYSHQFMAKEFKNVASLDDFRKFIAKYPILTEFDKKEVKEPVIEDGTAMLEVVLSKDNSHITLEYTLGIENDEWKVWGLQALEGKKEKNVSENKNSKLLQNL